MAKTILAGMPPEVRERLDNDFEPKRLEAAFRALAKHYGINLGPPPSPTVWADLFLALAADFLPAFQWARRARARKRGRQKDARRGDALRSLLSERKTLARIKSDVRACELIHKKWAAAPAHPFGKKLPSPTSLATYLAEARRQRLKEVTGSGGGFLGLLSMEPDLLPKRRRKHATSPASPPTNGLAELGTRTLFGRWGPGQGRGLLDPSPKK